MAGDAYALWLGLLTALCVGGYLVHRQFEDARRERRQIIRAVDFLERELARLRERLPLSDGEREILKQITDAERPDRDSDFK